MTIWHGTMKDGEITTQESILWDRKRDGGFPGMIFFSFISLFLNFANHSIQSFMHSLYTAYEARPVVLVSDRSFPYTEVKALKSLVRNVIAPNRDLGHTDRALKKEQGEQESKKEEESKGKAGCEDCQ